MNYYIFCSLAVIITGVYIIILYRDIVIKNSILVPMYLSLLYASFVIAPILLINFSTLFFKTIPGFYIDFERATKALVVVLTYFIPFLIFSCKRSKRSSLQISHNEKSESLIDFLYGLLLASLLFLVSASFPNLTVYLRPFSLMVVGRALIEKKRGLYLISGYLIPTLAEFSFLAPGLWSFLAILIVLLSIVLQFKKISISSTFLLIGLSALALVVLNGYKLILRGDSENLNISAFFVRIDSLRILMNAMSFIKEFDYFQKIKDTIVITTILPAFFSGVEVRDISNEFGHEIHVLRTDDFTTIVHPTHIAEFYYNLGPFGVLLGGFLIACILNGLDKLIKSSKKDLVVLGFLIFYSFANVERTFTYLVSGIVRSLYVWIIYLHIFYIIRHQATTKSVLDRSSK